METKDIRDRVRERVRLLLQVEMGVRTVEVEMDVRTVRVERRRGDAAASTIRTHGNLEQEISWDNGASAKSTTMIWLWWMFADGAEPCAVPSVGGSTIEQDGYNSCGSSHNQCAR